MINNFNAVDQLVEFGLGIAVAQQMVKMMNTTMAGVNAPTVKNPSIDTFRMPNPNGHLVQLYVGTSEGVAGPFDESQISALLAAHKITADTLAWMPGMETWTQASNIPLVNKYILLQS